MLYLSNATLKKGVMFYPSDFVPQMWPSANLHFEPGPKVTSGGYKVPRCDLGPTYTSSLGPQSSGGTKSPDVTVGQPTSWAWTHLWAWANLVLCLIPSCFKNHLTLLINLIGLFISSEIIWYADSRQTKPHYSNTFLYYSNSLKCACLKHKTVWFWIEYKLWLTQMSPLIFYSFSNHEYISVVLNSINIYVNKYALTPVVIHVVMYVTIDYACKSGQHIHFF